MCLLYFVLCSVVAVLSPFWLARPSFLPSPGNAVPTRRLHRSPWLIFPQAVPVGQGAQALWA